MERLTAAEYNAKYGSNFKVKKETQKKVYRLPRKKTFKVKTIATEPTDKELLDMWREIVFARAKYKCEYPNCEKTKPLHPHHIYSRGHKSTRYDPDNGIALCAGHHAMNNDSAHKDPDFKEIIICMRVRTREFYDKLRIKAFTPVKIDMNLEKMFLQSELNKLNK